jgi:hypothetical protein
VRPPYYNCVDMILTSQPVRPPYYNWVDMILTSQPVRPPYYNWVDMILTLHPGGSPYYIKCVVIESMPLISISKYKITFIIIFHFHPVVLRFVMNTDR